MHRNSWVAKTLKKEPYKLQINFSNSFDKTKSFTVNGYVVFQFHPGLNLIFLCFKLIIIHIIPKEILKLNQGQNWITTATTPTVFDVYFWMKHSLTVVYNIFVQCLVHTSVACITGDIFSRFPSELRKAGSERGALDTRDVAFPRRACLTLLARFPLSFARSKNAKKITPFMQANTSAISKCRRMRPLIFFLIDTPCDTRAL